MTVRIDLYWDSTNRLTMTVREDAVVYIHTPAGVDDPITLCNWNGGSDSLEIEMPGIWDLLRVKYMRMRLSLKSRLGVVRGG